jgi:ankyrin repeat protein
MSKLFSLQSLFLFCVFASFQVTQTMEPPIQAASKKKADSKAQLLFCKLYSAVTRRSIEEIRAALGAGAHRYINFSHPDGSSPLSVAIQIGHLEAVRTLITAGARVNNIIIGQACSRWGDDAEITTLLVAATVEQRRADMYSDGAPCPAQQVNNQTNDETQDQTDDETVEERKAPRSYRKQGPPMTSYVFNDDLLIRNLFCQLYIAAEAGLIGQIQKALKLGAHRCINFTRSNGSSPLSIAVQKGHLGAVTALLYAGATVTPTILKIAYRLWGSSAEITTLLLNGVTYTPGTSLAGLARCMSEDREDHQQSSRDPVLVRDEPNNGVSEASEEQVAREPLSIIDIVEFGVVVLLPEALKTGNPNACDADGRTLLEIAAHYEDSKRALEMVTLLLPCVETPNPRNQRTRRSLAHEMRQMGRGAIALLIGREVRRRSGLRVANLVNAAPAPRVPAAAQRRRIDLESGLPL